jgi:hypothetical protein
MIGSMKITTQNETKNICVKDSLLLSGMVIALACHYLWNAQDNTTVISFGKLAG